MTLTLYALFVLPFAFKMVLDPKGMRRVLKEWGDSNGMQFFSAVTILLFALLIFTTTELSFEWEWESLLSWLGVITVLKGVGMLVPSLNEWKVKVFTDERMPMAGFAAMLFALALIYIDTQVL